MKRSFSIVLLVCVFIVSVPLCAQEGGKGLMAWILSSIKKDGTVTIFPKSDDGSYGVSVQGVAAVAVLTFIAIKTVNTAADTAGFVMSYCPFGTWQQDYQRKQEEKQLDKELADAAFEEKRAKVMKLRHGQSR